METKKVKEYTVYEKANFYPFLTEDDFKLRKKLAVKRFILGKDTSRKLGIELVQLFDLDDRYCRPILESTKETVSKRAKELIFAGADLTVATTDFNNMGDFFLSPWSALDMVFWSKTFSEIKTLLLKAGADLCHTGLEHCFNPEDAEIAKKVIEMGFYHVDTRFTINTPLIMAVEWTRLESVKMLCELGANPFYRRNITKNNLDYHQINNLNYRKTALEVAKENVEYLKEEVKQKTTDEYKIECLNNAKTIVKLLETYEQDWIKNGKFIPEEYYDKTIVSSVVHKNNSELKKEDIGRITYKVEKLKGLEQAQVQEEKEL